MGRELKEYPVSRETIELVKGRVEKCFLCLWILKDYEKNGKLTGNPADYVGQKIFTVAGQVRHLELEGFLKVS